MGDNSKIEWTDASWNPIRARDRVTGKVGWFCTHASEGCRNCYAESFNGRLGTGIAYRAQDLRKVELFIDDKILTDPLRWRRPRKIFTLSMSDLFGEFIPDEMIDRLFAVMALCPQHTFLPLTKRPERMHRYLTEEVKGPWAGRAHVVDDDGTQRPMTDVHFRMNGVMCDLYPKAPPQALNFAAKWADDHYPDRDGFLRCWPLPNVWLGVSVEDQKNADDRIPILLQTPAAKRFISAEPLLGPVDLKAIRYRDEDAEIRIDALTAEAWVENSESASAYTNDADGNTRLDWVIVGGESGPGARPMHPEWARKIRGDCVVADVPFFFKQWGQFKDGGDFAPDAIAVLADGRQCDGTREALAALDRQAPVAPQNPTLMRAVGKKAAGRLLDGREWSEFPKTGGVP
jgi:protein gp37